MAANDFNDIKERSCYAGRRAITSTHAMARAGEFANEWHQSICDSGDDYSFLSDEGQVSLIAGTDRYTYASVATALGLTHNLREILSIVVDTEGGSSRPLQRVTWQELESISSSTQDGDATGVPFYWCRIGNSFRVYPSPDEAYDIGIKYRLSPVTLTADSDTFLVPDAWLGRLCISYVAMHLLWEDGSRDAQSAADRMMRKYDDDLKLFMDSYAYPDDDLLFRSPGLTRDLDTLREGDFWFDQ